MRIFELFSTRNRKPPEVYHYDFPITVRNQVVLILCDVFGTEGPYDYSSISENTLVAVQRQLCREYGLPWLSNGNQKLPPERDVIFFFLTTQIVDKALDFVMRTFSFLEDNYGYLKTNGSGSRQGLNGFSPSLSVGDAIKEVNIRFRNDGMGYSYEQGKIVKIDSTVAHSQITTPTLALIQGKKFAGANDEYLKAHDHYKAGRNKECLSECLKAFESTMKIICKEKKWNFDQHDTARKLIQICFVNNLVPSWSQNQFTSLQNLLESGIPTVRNKLGGHGQGQVPQKVDDDITRYALNLTGTNIIFLVERSSI